MSEDFFVLLYFLFLFLPGCGFNLLHMESSQIVESVSPISLSLFSPISLSCDLHQCHSKPSFHILILILFLLVLPHTILHILILAMQIWCLWTLHNANILIHIKKGHIFVLETFLWFQWYTTITGHFKGASPLNQSYWRNILSYFHTIDPKVAKVFFHEASCTLKWNNALFYVKVHSFLWINFLRA